MLLADVVPESRKRSALWRGEDSPNAERLALTCQAAVMPPRVPSCSTHSAGNCQRAILVLPHALSYGLADRPSQRCACRSSDSAGLPASGAQTLRTEPCPSVVRVYRS